MIAGEVEYLYHYCVAPAEITMCGNDIGNSQQRVDVADDGEQSLNE